MRFAPSVIELKRQLDAGLLGEVFTSTAPTTAPCPAAGSSTNDLAGGGAVLDHTVHVIDVLRWFWGAEVTEVCHAEIGDSLLHPAWASTTPGCSPSH